MRALPVVAYAPWDPVLGGTPRPELVVTLGEGVEDTRRRVLRVELEALSDPTSQLSIHNSLLIIIPP